LEREPGSGDFLNALAVYYAQQKQWDNAEYYIQRMAERFPDAPQVRQLQTYIQKQRNSTH